MPQRVLCQKCGTILYESAELRPPEEVVQRFDGKCPKCGKRLSFSPENVVIKPIK